MRADVLDWINCARPNGGRLILLLYSSSESATVSFFLVTVCEILLVLLTISGMVEDDMQKYPIWLNTCTVEALPVHNIAPGPSEVCFSDSVVWKPGLNLLCMDAKNTTRNILGNLRS